MTILRHASSRFVHAGFPQVLKLCLITFGSENTCYFVAVNVELLSISTVCATFIFLSDLKKKMEL